MRIQLKITALLTMSFAFVFFQSAEGSAVMPGTEEPLTCDICDKDSYAKWLETNKSSHKKSNKTWDVSQFDFNATNARKNPIWVNWIPAEPRDVFVKSPIEQKMEKDRSSYKGMQRDHYLFGKLMLAEEIEAKMIFNSETIKNKDFENENNFFTHHYDGKNKRDSKELGQDLEIQEELAKGKIIEMMSERNIRH